MRSSSACATGGEAGWTEVANNVLPDYPCHLIACHAEGQGHAFVSATDATLWHDNPAKHETLSHEAPVGHTPRTPTEDCATPLPQD